MGGGAKCGVERRDGLLLVGRKGGLGAFKQ